MGFLSLATQNCSGTLITRSVVLTAGHCFDGQPSSGGTFVIPTGPPNSNNNVTGQPYMMGTWKRLNNASDNAHDIACVPLTSPVPATVVPTLPRIYTGSIYTGWFTDHTIHLPGWIAGFGGIFPTATGKLPFPGGPTQIIDGNRRWGAAASDTQPQLDPCGDIGESHCNDDWEWEADRIVNPQTESGDSGGPLLMTDAAGPIIVGVDSGTYTNAIPQDQTPHTVWAPTGNNAAAAGDANNGKWLADNCFGADEDMDGVPDAIDNCPPSVCLNHDPPKDLSQCANPTQVDADGDGVGDDCDNCPPALCANLAADGQLPPTVRCFNPSQENSDGDSRGNACDLCPFSKDGDPIFPLAPQQDSDGDGVGDTCDTCIDDPNPYPTCFNLGDCATGICLIEPGAPSGYCADVIDSDGDGVPDACDLCPGFKNYGSNDNSNLIAEEREKLFDPDLPNLADVCDAVPLVRIPPQKIAPITPGQAAQYTPGDGVGPDDVATIDTNRWLGVDLDHPTLVSDVGRKVLYRHCSCADMFGTTFDLGQCTSDPTLCPVGNPLFDTGHGKIVTVADSTGPAGPDAVSDVAEDFKTSQTQADTLTWQWRSDVVAGTVTGLGKCPGTTALDCRTHGVLLARTLKTAPYASTREENHTLGDVFQIIDTLAIRAIPVLPQTCVPPCFVSFVHPDYLKDPDPFGFTAIFDRPTPFEIQSAGAVAAFVSPTLAFDIGGYIDSSTAGLIQNGAQILSAVEPTAVARVSHSFAVLSGVHTVALGPDYVGVDPVAIRTTSTGMTALVRERLPGDPPPVLHGVKGAFAATESSVYMVGGVTDQGFAGSSVWRWDLAQRGWQAEPLDGREVPSSRVLAVGYDTVGSRMYVVDIDDHDALVLPHKTHSYARIYRLDLASHDSTLLARVPYVGKATLAAIAVMPDGTLALVSAEKNSYRVWRLDGRGDQAVFQGVFAGQGTVLAGPVMGEDRLFLAVEKKDGTIETVDLSVDRFHGGPPCDSL